MVHIDRIQLRHFKSFRNADIMLSKGFVALVGPNGSGKSNICDGIRFVLGENSLKALRAKKVSDLITAGSEKAEIRLFLKENGKNIELRRAIRNDGKTKFRYNGKRMTRTAVMDALRPMGAEMGEHNVIAQGEVQEIVEMSAKERRGIIDGVSGISEFETKRAEALRELEKVDAKISDAGIVLKEREGYLTELEKEKNDALRYQELTSDLHRLRGSLIFTMMSRANDEHTKFLDRYLNLEKRIAEARKEMEYKKGQVAELEKEKSAIVNEINRRSEKGEAYREIEELKASLKVDADSLEAKTAESGEAERQQESLKSEEKNLARRVSALQEEIKKKEGEVLGSIKKVGELEKERTALLKTADDAEATFAELREKLEKLAGELEGARIRESQVAGGIAKEEGIKELKNSELSRLKAESASESAEVGKLKDDIERLKEAIKGLSRDNDKLFEKERSLNKDLPDIEKSWLKAKERVSELTARIGVSGKPLGVKAVLKMRDDDSLRGIYGTVSELCRFKPEYAVAIEASAGNRMEYVITESVDAAAKAIERLKKMKAGRCTFIPLDRKRSEELPKELEKKGLGPLIDFVSFEAKYRGAMNYVFGGTLLVSSVEEAKKVGPGRARMVTLDGDLFESSGIITGGMFTSRLFLKEKQELEEVEKRASGLKSEREFILGELNRIREEMSGARREKAEKEV
ncbi:MAG: AAA family ATPase, partial [Candidatus Micrarchaeota archaeon]